MNVQLGIKFSIIQLKGKIMNYIINTVLIIAGVLVLFAIIRKILKISFSIVRFKLLMGSVIAIAPIITAFLNKAGRLIDFDISKFSNFFDFLQ